MSEDRAAGGTVPARREVEGELLPTPDYPSPLGLRRVGRDERLEDLPVGTVVIWYDGVRYADAEDRRQAGVIEEAFDPDDPNVIRAISTIYQETVVHLDEMGESPVWVVDFAPAPGGNELPAGGSNH